MTPSERFVSLMTGLKEATPLSEPSADQLLLAIEDRPLHFWLSPARREITISTPVFLTDGAVPAEAIAAFNSFHLFQGGYRLSVDPLTKSIYASVTKALSRLEDIGLSKFVADFIPRCANCSRWCLDESLRHWS
jgi:hypothetical protein